MSRAPKFNTSEIASFALVPETCPVIDAAFDVGASHFDEPLAIHALNGNGITPTPALLMALREVVMRHLFPALKTVVDAAKYDGTYPLRLALVRQIERNSGVCSKPSIYEHWMKFRPPAALLVARKGGAV